MKKIIVLSLVIIISMIGYGQCDQKLLLFSSKTEYLDSNKVVQRTVDENTTIEISRTTVSIMPGTKEDEMHGPVKSIKCTWKIPFKEGKAVIKAALSDERGEVNNITITLEAKEGKLNLIAELDEAPEKKIRLAIDSMTERG